MKWVNAAGIPMELLLMKGSFFSRLSSEAAIGDVLYEKVFLEISQNYPENTCARVSFLIKL